jgi:hypothetical protein
MKAIGLSLLMVLVSALVLPACCTSIMCQATRAAQADLACTDEDLKVANLTPQVERDPADLRHFLKVEGCGRHELVACVPTNLPPPPAKKIRGQVQPRVSDPG